MPVNCAPTIEAPAGYTLLDRLGAGGYGEVWKATAPGGVEKAIKVVFGHCDEELAGRELKALDRIKSVRHPFLLSIERYEIVNHRLVIVSELADMSLDDRFKQAQGEGLPGVPREELLGYLSDAAEALDWLSERHDLQHLDIKPENLLLSSGHVKVADFGLVKDIASRTMNSLVGGMTPVYSAPEIYDDAPSRQSDQYSLAIVYQQMLTGVLPFPGRTPAQLAMQHMQAKPNLASLSDADKLAVGRALQKSPDGRFASCRDLITALRQGSTQGGSPATRPAAPAPTTTDEDTVAKAALLTKPQAAGSPPDPLDRGCVLTGAPVRKAEVYYPVVSEEVREIAPPDAALAVPSRPTPTLYIGVGGIGLDMLAHTRSAEAAMPGPAPKSQWLAIDTDVDSLKSLGARTGEHAFSNHDLLSIPLRRPKQYRDDSQALLKWLSRRWLYNIPRSLQTRGYRPLGRLALVDHAEQVLSAIASRLKQMLGAGASEQLRARVVIFAGAAGGTGSGCAIDVAQAARSVAERLSVDLQVAAVLGCTFSPDHPDSLAAANLYSFLTEHAATQQAGNQGESSPPGAAAFFERPEKPFDQTQLFSVPGRTDRQRRDQAFDSVAAFSLLQSRFDLAVALDRLHAETPDAAGPGRLECHGGVDLTRLVEASRSLAVDRLAGGLLDYCLHDVGDASDGGEEWGSLATTRFADCFSRMLQQQQDQQDGPDATGETQQATQGARANAIACLESLARLRQNLTSGGATVEPPAAQQQFYDKILHRLGQELAHGACVEGLTTNDLADMIRLAAPESDRGDSAIKQVVAGCQHTDDLLRPLRCGGYRMSLLAHVTGDPAALTALPLRPRDVEQALRDGREQVMRLTLGGGVSPLHVGAKLALSFPGIEEAASRLHSRSDIAWKPMSSYA